jgi:hypothetical protein
MTESVIHPVGRFNVRVVPAPHPLYHGGRSDFSRERRDYERGTILEVFDAAYPHTEAGQFVTAYAAKTLASLAPGSRLALYTDIPAWTMTEDETAALTALARAV